MALIDDIVSYWRLDEASGDALDAHSTNDLTDTNTVGSGTGKINNARDFETTNSEYFTIADNASLSREGKSFSVTGWFNTESSLAYIMRKVGGFPNFEFAIGEIFNGTGNFLSLRIYDNSGGSDTVWASTFGALSTSTWYFFWCAVDLTNSLLKISINDGTVDTAAITRSISAGSADFEIGVAGGSGFPTYHDGLIDEVGLWDRVLTSGEITQLYNSGNGLAYPFSGGATIFTQSRYRWRNDDGSQTTATWKAAEDTLTSTAKLVPLRLRTQVTIAGTDPGSQAVTLQYRKVGATDWKDVRKL